MKSSNSNSAADEMNYLKVIAIAKASLLPLIARNYAAVEFNCDSV